MTSSHPDGKSPDSKRFVVLLRSGRLGTSSTVSRAGGKGGFHSGSNSSTALGQHEWHRSFPDYGEGVFKSPSNLILERLDIELGNFLSGETKDNLFIIYIKNMQLHFLLVFFPPFSFFLFQDVQSKVIFVLCVKNNNNNFYNYSKRKKN